MRQAGTRTGRCGGGALLGVLLAGSAGADSLRLEPANVLLSVEVIARDLHGPDGLAIEPVSRDLFVAERTGNRISRIHQKRVEPAIPDGFEVQGNLPDWAIQYDRTGDDWGYSGLRSPTAVAFDGAGTLYVAEAGDVSRILCFSAEQENRSIAELITTPWMRGEYGYTGLRADREGRLYVTVRKTAEDLALPFGNVMKREPGGGWWMIDYGPFTEFGAAAIDPRSEFVILTERRSADVCWYDRTMEVCFASMEELAGVREVALLKDGTTLAAMEQANGTWSVVELDARQSVIREWIGGLSPIGDLCPDLESGALYVSLQEEGKVLRINPIDRQVTGPHLLSELRRKFQEEHALPPTEWPDFFRDFIAQLDVVEPVNRWEDAQDATRRSVTLGEFAEAIPLVAAKVKATLISSPDLEPDPIEEVSFVQFYPDQLNMSTTALAPSLSLFCAKHRSGKRHMSRIMLPGQAGQLNGDVDWQDLPNILLPSPYGTRVQTLPEGDGNVLHVYYVDMFGLESQLYDIAINRTDPSQSVMTVRVGQGMSGADGEPAPRIHYRLEALPERAEAGGTTVLIADHTVQKRGWYEVSDYPVMWNIIVQEPEKLSLRHALSVGELQAREVRVEADVAADFQRTALRRDIAWRRELIKQSAVQWSSAHF